MFKDEYFFSLQRVRTTFVFLLWTETRKIIQDDLSNIAGFIDRVGCKLSWFCAVVGKVCLSFCIF